MNGVGFRPQLPILWIAFLSVLLVGCVGTLDAPIRPGLLVEPEILRSGFATVCPFQVTTAVPVGDEAATKEKLASLDTLLAEELEHVGLRVVEPSRVKETWEQSKREVGGFYDVIWGRVQTEKKHEAETSFFAAAAKDLDCDAVVYARVVPVEAPYWQGAARWDHATWTRIFPVVGWIPALSFELVIETGIDREVYYGVGGIGVRVKRAGQNEVDLFDELEPDALLTGAEANRQAIRKSLLELGKALAPPE